MLVFKEMERRPSTNNNNMSHMCFFDRAVHLWCLGLFYVLVIIDFKENKFWFFCFRISGLTATQHHSGHTCHPGPSCTVKYEEGSGSLSWTHAHLKLPRVTLVQRQPGLQALFPGKALGSHHQTLDLQRRPAGKLPSDCMAFFMGASKTWPHLQRKIAQAVLWWGF